MSSATMSSDDQTTYMLDSDEIRADERDVIDLAEHTNNTRMINTRDEDSQKIDQEGQESVVLEGRMSKTYNNYSRQRQNAYFSRCK